MPWRRIFSIFFHQRQDEIVRKLADSALMRRAARFSAYWLLRGKDKGARVLKEKEGSLKQVSEKVGRFKRAFYDEIEKEKKRIGKQQ